jgi:uncharacterized protein (TIGR03382 family)
MKRGAFCLFAIVGLSSATAFAHIHLTNPLSRTDNTQGDPQKNGHCGDPAYSRAANPTRTTVYPPGATVTVTWAETVDHPGHFRIAFQPAGDTFSLPPVGTGLGNFQTELETQEGMTDTATGTMILADMIPDGTLSKQITLPNMECTNCTLQFIQVMTNGAPYNHVATQAEGNNDLYFNCADITLQAGASMPPDPMAGDDAGPGAGDGGIGAVGGHGEITRGCSTSSSSTTALFGLALLAGLRRRRR